MKDNSKISLNQLSMILITVIPSTSMIFLSTTIYEEAKRDFWISLIILIIMTIFFSLFITKLALMYKSKNLIEICNTVVGKFFGSILGIIFLVFFIQIDSVILREFSFFLNETLFIDTPTWFLSLGILIPCVYMLFKEIETLARIAEFIFYIFVASILIIVVLSFSEVRLYNLFPILSESPISIIKGSMKMTIWSGEFFILLMFTNKIKNIDGLTKSVIISILVMGILLLLATVTIVSTFGTITEELSFPFLSLARYVNVGESLERMDAFIIILWISAIFLKIAVFLYCSVATASTLLKTKNVKPFIIPFALIIFILSEVVWENSQILKEKILKEYFIYYTIVQIAVPIIIFLIANIKERISKNAKS